jgi:hypothetical protein
MGRGVAEVDVAKTDVAKVFRTSQRVPKGSKA